MKLLNRFILGVVFLVASSAAQAGLGTTYNSYRDMHLGTQFGALFFNNGAINIPQNRSKKNYVEILNDGTLDLPLQKGYCFVFNHYGNGTLPRREYSAKITKTFRGNHSSTQTFVGHFTPTDRAWSDDMPDICITRLKGVERISIEFGSSIGNEFDWRISFDLK